MTVNMQKPIVIFRGDNTAAFDLRTIKILLTGDLDLTNATARFDLLDFTKSWTTEEVATGELSIVFDSAQTKSFALGPQVGTLRLFDMSTGTPRQLTIINKIPFFVTNRVCELDNQNYEAEVCVASGEVIHVEFNVGVGAVEGKTDKVKNATAGDLAGLNAEGNLTDSGIPASDVLRKSQMDSTPTLGSQNPVTSDGIKQAIDAATPSDYEQVKAQVEANAQDIANIDDVIPPQATENNQLADKAFVNSSIATNTATFRGTYNLVRTLGLSVAQKDNYSTVGAALKTYLDAQSVTQENNDYCFVQVPKTDAEPTVIECVDRYKCTVTESGGVTTRVWEYEWSLNNSSFTADQWAAINSGITSGLVAKLINLPSAEELLGKGYLVFQPSRNGFDGVSGDTAAIQRNASSLWGYNPSADSSYSVGFLINPVAYSGAAIKNGSYYVSADPLANYITSYRQVLLSSLTIDLYVSDNVVSDIRLSVKDASGENTLFSSDWIDEITTGSSERFEFSFPGNDVWLDGGTQYRFIIEGRNAFGDEMSASVRLLRNQIYTYAQNKGVKWSSILANGTAVETQDYALEMTMGVTATITAQIPLANLMDVGFMGFSELTEYHTGDRCVYNGNLYECTPSGNNHKGPWVANHFKLVMSLSENITMGGALPFSAHGNPTSNIILGFNAASAAGSQNIVLGYSATAHRTNTGTYSDTTSGNVVIGAAATVDNNGSPNFAPNDNVVIGKYSKSHGSYAVVLGVNSEVTGDSGLAIGNNAKVTHAGAIAIGNDAVSNGAGTATLAISALNKFFLGSSNIVDLINAAVNTAIQNQTIAAAVSTTTGTGGGRRLLAAATPDSTTKTEVTAADIGALGNTGNQTLDGTLTVGYTRIEDDKIVYDVGAAGESNLRFPGGVSDYLAVLSDIYAAVQQIAPAWVSGISYAQNTLVTYNGVVYRCKLGYTATISSPKPNSDTTHWEAKKVSELFLPLTGGTMTGSISFDNGYQLYPGLAGLYILNPSTGESWYFWGDQSQDDAVMRRKNIRTLAPLASPAFTGTPTAPTPTSGDNSTKVATTAFVQGALPYAIDSVPSGDALADRTVNTITINAATYAPSFPAETSGKSCDFYLAITSDTAGTVSAPSGKTLYNAKGESANLDYEANKTTVLRFTQIGADTYVVTGGANGGGSVDPATLNTKLDSVSAAPAFSTSATYAEGEYVTYQGKLYYAKQAITTAEAWTAAHWQEDRLAPYIKTFAAAITALSQRGYVIDDNGQPVAVFPDGTVPQIDGYPLRYSIPASVALTATNDEATLVLADRAVTNATIATGFSTLNLTFPTAISGKVRDFYLRITVAAGESAPAMVLPQGITAETPDGSLPAIADGGTSAASTTIVYFSETSADTFIVKAETVTTVASAA